MNTLTNNFVGSLAHGNMGFLYKLANVVKCFSYKTISTSSTSDPPNTYHFDAVFYNEGYDTGKCQLKKKKNREETNNKIEKYFPKKEKNHKRSENQNKNNDTEVDVFKAMNTRQD